MRRMHWSLSLIGWGFIFTLLLPACTALPAAGRPPDQPADLPLANLQTRKLAHLHQAAYNYARYQTLAPDDLLGPSARLRTSLKRLAEVCAALEDPSTGPFGEAQDRLRAGAGVDDESCREATERVIRNSQFARGAGGPY